MLPLKTTAQFPRKKKLRPPVHKSVEPCLKVPDVATILGISRARAYELVNSNGFPRITIGKRITIPHSAFMDWMEANTVTQRTADNSIGL